MKIKKMTQIKLEEILEKHEKWLNNKKGGERANLSGSNLRGSDLRDSDLRGSDLSYSDLRGSDLRYSDLRGSNLRYSNLRYSKLSGSNLRGSDLRDSDLRDSDLRYGDLRDSDLRGSNLRGSDLRGSDLRYSDLSGCKGLLSSIDYMEKNFKKTKEGYICYKTFNSNYGKPDYWKIKKGSVVSEVVNPCRTIDCTCGVNVGTLAWVKNNNSNDDKEIWKCLIKWEWLAGVVVPYHTDGKIRCEKVKLLEVI